MEFLGQVLGQSITYLCVLQSEISTFLENFSYSISNHWLAVYDSWYAGEGYSSAWEDVAGLYTGRKHIVDRLCAVVLLDIHRTDVERAFCRSVGAAVEVVLICAPFAPHEFEGGKAQVGCLFEAGHEHAHKADGREVVD